MKSSHPARKYDCPLRNSSPFHGSSVIRTSHRYGIEFRRVSSLAKSKSNFIIGFQNTPADTFRLNYQLLTYSL